MSEFKVTAHIEAVDRASKKFEDVSRSAGRLAMVMGKLSHTAQIAGGIIAANIGLKAIDAVESFVSGSIDAFARQEEAVNSLKAQLEVLGEDWCRVRDRMLEAASEMQSRTVYGDEQVIAAMQVLATYGMKSADIIRYIGAVADFAAAKHISLQTAADLVGKAFTGYTSTLSRYGIIIDKAIPESERFSAVVEQINQMFGGAAQAQITTYAGRMQQLQNRIGDLQEELGAFLAPAVMRATEAFSTLFSWLEEVGGVVQKELQPLIRALTEAGGELWLALQHLAEAVGLNLDEAESAGSSIALLLKVALTPLLGVVEGLTAAIEGLSMVVKGWRIIIAETTPIVLGVAYAIGSTLGSAIHSIKSAIEVLGGVWKNVLEGMRSVWDHTIAPIVHAVDGVVASIAGAFGWLSDRLVGHSIWSDMFAEMKVEAERFVRDIHTLFNQLTPPAFTPTTALSWAGGSITVNVYATTPASAEEIGRAVVSALRRRRR